MNTFLLKKFIKDYENVKEPKVRENYGKLAGVVGIISNTLLCAMKILVGIVSGSIAIIADGINNLADASSSIITLIGFKLASLPEDEEHPYGHARIEYLTGLVVSVLIIIVGIQLLQTSVEKILNPSIMNYSISTIIVLILAIIIKIWQASFNVSLGKRINSVALLATGADSRNDVISTTVVLLSVIIGQLTSLAVDGYIGCLVALFIIWSGISLVKETISPLLGEAPDPELVQTIADLSSEYPGVLGIHDLVVHNYGPGKIFASIHIEVDAKGDLMESHDLIDNIEKEISEKLKIYLVAHMDPINTHDPLLEKVATIVTREIEKIEGIDSYHDLRAVIGPSHTNIIFDVVQTPGIKINQKEITACMEKALAEIQDNLRVVITFDVAYTSIPDKSQKAAHDNN